MKAKVQDLVRSIGLRIPWQLEYKEMIHTDQRKCAGFVTKCGRVVMYGDEYRKLYNLGRIRGWTPKQKQ